MSHSVGHLSPPSAVNAASPAVLVAPRASTTKLRCARCLHTIELMPDQVRSRIRCTQCRRKLRVPRQIKHPCPRCGCHGRYHPDASGRHVHCRNCSAQIIVPPQLAKPRRRHRSNRSPRDASVVSLVVSLIISLIAVFLCLQLL